MNEEMFSFKEFENVRLKATYNIELGDRIIVPGETIVKFDKIQIAGFNEVSSRVSANGGYGNRARVFWDNTRELRLTFSQGVFSHDQFALLYNSRLLESGGNNFIDITERENLESDEEGKVTLKYTPSHEDLVFVYEAQTCTKITDFSIEENVITISEPFIDLVIDYSYTYTNGARLFKIGKRLINGFVELEGRTRIKDDTTGQVSTGLVVIPHLRLMSDLSIRLGKQASPIVGNFTGVGVPVGLRENTYVSEIYFLSDDIESDL